MVALSHELTAVSLPTLLWHLPQPIHRWWHRDIEAADKLPLMLSFVAFVLTFVVTRVITRRIRAGRGPFRDHVTGSGLHVHHAVPGIVLLSIGAFTAVGPATSTAWRCTAAIMVGTGVSLVLDEFALILHLQDVYWTGEGQLSITIVSLTAAILALVLAGLNPVGVNNVGGTELAVRIGASGILSVHALLLVACVLKGKYRVALLGLVVPIVAELGAFRLARPTSAWARHRYGQGRMRRAGQRSAAFDQRWQPVLDTWDKWIGGTTTTVPPTPTTIREPNHQDGRDGVARSAD